MKHIGVFSFTILFLFVSVQIVEAGFGVSPPEIIENRLVPGSSFERTIQLVQGNPEKDVAVEVSVDSSSIKDWVSFPGGRNFVIPAGIQQYPMKVLINVPEDAELGIYKAFVRISTVPERAEGAENTGQVAIALGGRVDVEIEVGNDLFSEYEIRDIEILDIKEGERPQVRVKISNTGNVPVSPESATFELFNKFGDIRLAFSQSEEFEPVPSFSEGEIVIEFPIEVYLAVGEYWGHTRIYDEDGSIKRELRTPFNVSEKTFFEKFGLWLYATASILFLVLVGFAAYILAVRRKNKKLREHNSTNQS